MKHNNLATQHQLSKWFLALLVCFGFFVFAGGFSSNQPNHNKVVQTELIFKAAQTNNKKFVSYYNKLRSLNKFHFKWTTNFEAFILVNLERSLKTKFKQLQQSYSNWIIFYFSPLKTIPQNFKEAITYLPLG